MNNNNYIDQMFKNEQRQKRTTIVAAVLCIVIIIVIVSLFSIIQKKTKEIEAKKDEIKKSYVLLETKNDSLKLVQNQLKIANNQLKQDSVSMSHSAAGFEKRNADFEKLITLYKTDKKAVIKPDLTDLESYNDNHKMYDYMSESGSSDNNDKGSAVYTPEKTTNKPDAKSNKSIDNLLNKIDKKQYTLYIQYSDKAAARAQNLKELFTTQNYTVPQAQQMTNMKFASCVKYFYPSDKDAATKIADEAKKSTAQEFKVVYQNLKAPKNQLEIWVYNDK